MITIETSQAGLQWIRDNMPNDLYIVLKELELDIVVVGITDECFDMMREQDYPYYFEMIEYSQRTIVQFSLEYLYSNQIKERQDENRI